MRATGLIRTIDNFGRLLIPKEIRMILDINPKQPMEIFLDDHNIIISKYQHKCILCNGINGLDLYRAKVICSDCVKGNTISSLNLETDV